MLLQWLQLSSSFWLKKEHFRGSQLSRRTKNWPLIRLHSTDNRPPRKLCMANIWSSFAGSPFGRVFFVNRSQFRRLEMDDLATALHSPTLYLSAVGSDQGLPDPNPNISTQFSCLSSTTADLYDWSKLRSRQEVACYRFRRGKRNRAQLYPRFLTVSASQHCCPYIPETWGYTHSFRSRIWNNPFSLPTKRRALGAKNESCPYRAGLSDNKPCNRPKFASLAKCSWLKKIGRPIFTNLT